MRLKKSLELGGVAQGLWLAKESVYGLTWGAQEGDRVLLGGSWSLWPRGNQWYNLVSVCDAEIKR